MATRGTAAALRNAGLTCKTVFKVNEGRPNAVDLLKGGKHSARDLHHHRRARVLTTRRRSGAAAVQYRVPCITTMSGARAAAEAVAAKLRDPDPRVEPAGNPRGEEDGGFGAPSR